MGAKEIVTTKASSKTKVSGLTRKHEHQEKFVKKVLHFISENQIAHKAKLDCNYCRIRTIKGTLVIKRMFGTCNQAIMTNGMHDRISDAITLHSLKSSISFGSMHTVPE